MSNSFPVATSFPVRPLEPPERLTKDRFERHHVGLCKYCQTKDGSPGVVKMVRNSVDFHLVPDHCFCCLCGQKYYIEYEDLEAFIGVHPSAEGIEPYPKMNETARFRYRSIDAEWKPS